MGSSDSSHSAFDSITDFHVLSMVKNCTWSLTKCTTSWWINSCYFDDNSFDNWHSGTCCNCIWRAYCWHWNMDTGVQWLYGMNVVLLWWQIDTHHHIQMYTITQWQSFHFQLNLKLIPATVDWNCYFQMINRSWIQVPVIVNLFFETRTLLTKIIRCQCWCSHLHNMCGIMKALKIITATLKLSLLNGQSVKLSQSDGSVQWQLIQKHIVLLLNENEDFCYWI